MRGGEHKRGGDHAHKPRREKHEKNGSVDFMYRKKRQHMRWLHRCFVGIDW